MHPGSLQSELDCSQRAIRALDAITNEVLCSWLLQQSYLPMVDSYLESRRWLAARHRPLCSSLWLDKTAACH
eukprot:46933-Eustigmatos_ZCMA.PRE.1